MAGTVVKIHLEPIVLIGRGWHTPGDDYGDPYDTVMTIHKFGTRAEIVARAGRLTPAGYRNLKQQLLDLGVKEVTWDHNGRRERREIAVKEIS